MIKFKLEIISLTHCMGRDIKENEMFCCRDYDFTNIHIPDN